MFLVFTFVLTNLSTGAATMANFSLNLKSAALAVGIALGGTYAASATAGSIIQFDPLGGGVGNNTSSFQWTTDNAVALGGITATNNFLANLANGTALSTRFDLLSHGKLLAANDPASVNFLPGSYTGATPTREITFVLRTTEEVVGASPFPGSADYRTLGGAGSFFELWYDDSPDSNALNGTGYNDGVMILSGTIIPTGLFNDATFTLQRTFPGLQPVVQRLDQFGTDNYNGTNTVVGKGSFGLLIDVQSANASYFPEIGNYVNFRLDTDGELNTPFNKVDPSRVFCGVAGGAACAVAPVTGLVNGQNGPDFRFQTSPQTSFEVPEPAGLALIASALLFGGFASRRSKKS